MSPKFLSLFRRSSSSIDDREYEDTEREAVWLGVAMGGILMGLVVQRSWRLLRTLCGK